MATFIPQVTDQFPQQSLYTPDYNFLMMGYGQKQAQYDRGFSAVKNMYGSLLNSPLSNGENIQHRTNLFKSIENKIRSISGLDLSNSSVASNALTTFDPIINDQELMHDIRETSNTFKELSLAEAQRNSSDAKVRAEYNPLSVEDLNYVLQDLREAKRGDGSIQAVSSRKYVNYVDVMGALEKAAKEQDLKIVKSGTQGGYILTKTNGEGAVPAFTDWAASKISNDPLLQQQLQVQGRVNSRRDVDRIIQTTGMSRGQARDYLAANVASSILTTKVQEYDMYRRQNAKLDQSLAILKRKYETKGLTPEEAATVEKLKQQKDIYTAYSDGIGKEIEELESGDIEYLSRNLESIYTEQAFKKMALDFGRRYAMSNVEEKIEADQVVLTKWRLEQDIQDRLSRERIAMMQEDRADARLMLDIKSKKELELLKLNPQGVQTGWYTPAEGQGVVPDFVLEQYNEEFYKSFDIAFSKEGVMGSIPDLDQSKYYPGLYKLNRMSKGEQVELKESDIQNLEMLADKFNKNFFVPNNAADAKALIRGMMSGLRDYASQAVAGDYTSDKSANALKISSETAKMMASINTQVDYLSRVENEMAEISKIITKPDGTLHDRYSAAKLLTYTKEGVPVYDISGLSIADKNELSMALPPEYRDNSILTGKVYNYTNVNASQLKSILNSGVATRVTLNKDDVTEDYLLQEGDGALESIMGLNGEPLEELLGKAVTTKHDPLNKKVIFEFNVDPSSNVAKSISSTKGGEFKLQVEVPVSSLNAEALQTFKTAADKNSVKYFGLGITDALYKNPEEATTVTLPDYLKNAGVDLDISGQKLNSGYQVIIEGTVPRPDGTRQRVEKVMDIDLESNGRPSQEKLQRIEQQVYNLAFQVMQGNIDFSKSKSTEDALIRSGITF